MLVCIVFVLSDIVPYIIAGTVFGTVAALAVVCCAVVNSSPTGSLVPARGFRKPAAVNTRFAPSRMYRGYNGWYSNGYHADGHNPYQSRINVQSAQFPRY